MGDTRRLAERMGLLDMEPRGELSSTEYALASPGTEYVVLEPTESTDPFTLNVAAGSYAAEWYDVTSRETVPAAEVTVPAAEVTVPAAEVTVPTAGPVSFRAPYPAAGPAVLRLRRANGRRAGRAGSRRRPARPSPARRPATFLASSAPRWRRSSARRAGR